MGDSRAAGGAGAQGGGGVHPVSWGSQRSGGRAGGRLNPDVKVTIEGDRPPRLDGDVVTFEDMREFLVACLKYEQQMHVANEDGRDRVIARRRELVDYATQMMAADEFYDGKPWIYLSAQRVGVRAPNVCWRLCAANECCGFLPPDLLCAEDGCKRAGRQQGVHAKACPAKAPCRRRVYGRGEARWSAVHVEAWLGAGKDASSGNRATRVSPQGRKGDNGQSRSG